MSLGMHVRSPYTVGAWYSQTRISVLFWGAKASSPREIAGSN